MLRAWLLSGNGWVALAAGASAAQSSRLAGAVPDSVLCLGLACCTWVLYTVHRRVGGLLHRSNLREERFGYVFRHDKVLLPWLLVGAATAFGVWLYLPPKARWFCLLCALPALGYVLPVLPERRRLRDLPYIKPLLVAGVWTAATWALPLLLAQKPLIALCAAERFVWFLLLALPFDRRDAALDREQGVRTLAGELSERSFVLLCRLLAGLWLVLAAGAYPPVCLPLWAVCAAGMAWVWLRPGLVHGLDALPLVQCLGVFALV